MTVGLDPVIHPPKRLAAIALLASARSVTFPFLRQHLQVKDADLSKQMAALAEAGYVEIHKRGRGPGSVTTFRITTAGRTAYRQHRAALQKLLAAADPVNANGD